MTLSPRMSSGAPGLDALLGGGLLPGALTVVLGATGIGKTQLGVQFAEAGRQAEGQPGVLFDMNARVDAQNHAAYAQRMRSWSLSPGDPERRAALDEFFRPDRPAIDYLHVFRQDGRRLTRSEVSFDIWHDWQAELSSRLAATIEFFYAAFTRGVRRAVVDGVDPAERQSDSVQFELFEYIYHQILRKESDWVARDLFRERFRAHADEVAAHAYDHRQIACLLLLTSHETMLEGLIERPLGDSDLLAGANTVLCLGKIRDGHRLRRALYVAKHRGSACSDEIAYYRITDAGLEIES